MIRVCVDFIDVLFVVVIGIEVWIGMVRVIFSLVGYVIN